MSALRGSVHAVADYSRLVAKGRVIRPEPYCSDRISSGSMPIRSLTASAQLLLAPEVTFGGLDRDVTEQEMDLIQFTAGEAAKPRASAPKVVRSELLYPCPRGTLPHNLPQHLRRHSAAPDPAGLVDRTKERALP